MNRMLEKKAKSSSAQVAPLVEDITCSTRQQRLSPTPPAATMHLVVHVGKPAPGHAGLMQLRWAIQGAFGSGFPEQSRALFDDDDAGAGSSFMLTSEFLDIVVERAKVSELVEWWRRKWPSFCLGGGGRKGSRVWRRLAFIERVDGGVEQ